MVELSELIARLEAARGPDRELDADLSEHFGGVFYQHPSWSVQTYVTAAPLTASIDAALALVERLLPGWWRSVSESAGGWWAGLLNPEGGYVSSDAAPTAPRRYFPNGALAILIALLCALEKDKPHD